MTERSVRDTVLAFFEARDATLPAGEDALLGHEYLDLGVLDSMGIVTMVVELESSFGIRFAAEDMQSVEFRSIGGLIALIERRRAEATGG